MAVTLCVSTSKYLKPAINRAKSYFPKIATKRFWSPHQARSAAILGHVAHMSSALEVAEIVRTASHFREKLFECLGAEGKISADTLAKGLPCIFEYQAQCGTEKKTKEMKAKSLNKDGWFPGQWMRLVGNEV